MKKYGVALIILSGIFNAFGQFFWKLSHAEINLFLFAGFMFFGLGGLLMVMSLKYGELSKLHSLTAFGYVIAFCLSVFYFHEDFSNIQLLGCLMITVGVIRMGVANA